VLFSIAIVVIPFIASRLVRGEVGNTVSAMISAASLYASAAAKTLMASSSSSQSASAGPPPSMSQLGPPTGSGPGPTGTAAAANAGSSGGGLLSESKPPAPLAEGPGTIGEIGASGTVMA
jgi:hypothetical protein